MEDDAIRTLLTRLSRPHSSGGSTISHAAIMAEGADSTAVVDWIMAHDGRPEAAVAKAAAGGLHSSRLQSGSSGGPPRRYVLPAGALTAPAEPAERP